MKLILDTHIALWCLEDSSELPDKARALIEDPQNEVLISAVSMWEMSIKWTHGKLKVEIAVLENGLTDMGFDFLPITIAHAITYARIPVHHRDPFDRMLVAQSTAESARLISHDRFLRIYGPSVQIV